MNKFDLKRPQIILDYTIQLIPPTILILKREEYRSAQLGNEIDVGDFHLVTIEFLITLSYIHSNDVEEHEKKILSYQLMGDRYNNSLAKRRRHSQQWENSSQVGAVHPIICNRCWCTCYIVHII